jgi:hypothetical protein
MSEESVLIGEPACLEGTNYLYQMLTNGHRLSWLPDQPFTTSLGTPRDGDDSFWASSEFDGWIDTTTYDEVGFFVKEDGRIRFARVSFGELGDASGLHALAMIEIWNRYSGKHYELMGDGIGWAECKKGRNNVPPGVELKDVHSFYYLTADLKSVHGS